MAKLNNEVQYMYVRDAARFPVACIALKVEKNMTDVSFALSIYNPTSSEPHKRDTFSRPRARQVAYGRFLKYPTTLNLPVLDTDFPWLTVKYTILSHLIDTRKFHIGSKQANGFTQTPVSIPGRVQKALMVTRNLLVAHKDEERKPAA